MYNIKDGCPGCGICKASCPMGAIKVNEKAEILIEKCISCGICEPLCPVKLIYEDKNTIGEAE